MKDKYTKDLFIDESEINKSVTQSNLLIRASHDLTLNEKRLFLLAACKINPTKWKQEWLFRVEAKEWEKAFPEANNKNIYRDMKKACSELMHQKPMRILSEDKREIEVHWISSAEYLDKEGVIELEISDKLRYYLAFIMLQEFGFTTLAMRHIGKLNSRHSMRVYELLMQFYNPEKKGGWLKITPDEIIEIFKLPESYSKNRSSIMQKVIAPSIKNINESSNLTCEAEISKKNGRSISQYLIKFKLKEGIPS